MDLNHILFLAAVLNLLGDLYNIVKFRRHLPSWILTANILALAACIVARLIFVPYAGLLSLGILLVYVLAVKTIAKPATNRPLPALASRYTKLLIALNGISFGHQITSNAVTSVQGLVEIGAMFGPLLEAGQWWRLFTAQFLHWGAVHLLFNMLGLWLLGPPVETKLGGFRFVVTYLFCGAGGMFIAWFVSTMSAEPEPIVMLGASASVLSLVGIQAALSLREYRSTGSIAAKAQLSAMAQIVLLQALFDSFVPEVSSTAHLGGAACGFIIGMALKTQRPTLTARRAQPDFQYRAQPASESDNFLQ
jgi:membrane associated rhomboid family serine protease